MKHFFKKFIFPGITPRFLLRIVGVAVTAFLFFNLVCIPLRIKGHSMTPTYLDGRFNFCFRLRYLFSKPQKKDVVVIRLAGRNVMLLKRIIALEGETVEFKAGQLFVNGKRVEEKYIHGPSDWNLPLRSVKKEHVYVVGDNRRVPMGIHQFGQTPANRIIGGPLW
jgi:signal peptidase I